MSVPYTGPSPTEWPIEWTRSMLALARSHGHAFPQGEGLLAEVDRLRGGPGDPLPAAELAAARRRADELTLLQAHSHYKADTTDLPPGMTGNVALDVLVILLDEIDSWAGGG